MYSSGDFINIFMRTNLNQEQETVVRVFDNQESKTFQFGLCLFIGKYGL